MTKRQGKSGTIDVKAVLGEDEEFLRALVRTALQEVLETEMTEVLGAEKGERVADFSVLVRPRSLNSSGLGNKEILDAPLRRGTAPGAAAGNTRRGTRTTPSYSPMTTPNSTACRSAFQRARLESQQRERDQYAKRIRD
jgi:Transposase, Mutator family